MSRCQPEDLKVLENYIFKAVEEIAELLAYGETHHTESSNQFGDKQLELDVLSDEIMYKNLRASQKVKFALSEEEPVPQDMGGQEFIVTFDPLDGSSIIDVNWAVGTIFAVWPAESNNLIGYTGKDIITSGIALYGPRTTIVRYNYGSRKVDELTLKKNEKGETFWHTTKEELKVAEKTKIFAPANLRAASDNQAYNELFEFWKSNKYTLRYSGGLVPDIYQILSRGNGVFSNPSSESAPAKLRFLYEVAPVAFIMEKAGGRSTNGTKSILDIEVVSYIMKSTLCLGSAQEVDRFEKLVGQAL